MKFAITAALMMMMLAATAEAEGHEKTAQLSVTVTVIRPPTPEQLKQATVCRQIDPGHRVCTVNF